MRNVGVEAIAGSALLVGFPRTLSTQRLFNLGLAVEDDPMVAAAFRSNLDIVLRAGEDVDVFAIMSATLSTFSAADLCLIRRRAERR